MILPQVFSSKIEASASISWGVPVLHLAVLTVVLSDDPAQGVAFLGMCGDHVLVRHFDE